MLNLFSPIFEGQNSIPFACSFLLSHSSFRHQPFIVGAELDPTPHFFINSHEHNLLVTLLRFLHLFIILGSSKIDESGFSYLIQTSL